jgi:hypothetical protein
MPIYYRGAGLGTYWHMNDACKTGFTPHYPGAGQGNSRILHHIARGTTASPYVSLTRSYGVAWGYALAGRMLPSAEQPAYVYEIEVDENDGLGTRLMDPVTTIAAGLGSPYDTRTYHHDGDSSFLLGLVDPAGQRASLKQEVRFPPPEQGTIRTPLLHIELEALVRALRDSEILAFGAVAASQVRRRIEVY